MGRWNQRVKRFVVAEDSMIPTLWPGDGVVVLMSKRVRRGQLRCFEHPARPGFWLVKRVGQVSGSTFEAISDNALATTVDSRRFGSVPVNGSYRVLFVVRDRRRDRSDGQDRRSQH